MTVRRPAAGKLCIGLALVALGVAGLLFGRGIGVDSTWVHILPFLVGTFFIIYAFHASAVDASQDRGIGPTAEKEAEISRAFEKKMRELTELANTEGKDAFYRKMRITVERGVDGSVAVTGWGPTWKVSVAVLLVPLVIGGLFLWYKWDVLREEWILLSIVEAFPVAFFLIALLCIGGRSTCRISTDGVTSELKWPLLPTFKKFCAWNDLEAVHSFDDDDEPLYPDIYLDRKSGGRICVDQYHLGTACEEAGDQIGVPEPLLLALGNPFGVESSDEEQVSSQEQAET